MWLISVFLTKSELQFEQNSTFYLFSLLYLTNRLQIFLDLFSGCPAECNSSNGYLNVPSASFVLLHIRNKENSAKRDASLCVIAL